MKRAIVLLYKSLSASGLIHSRKVCQVATVHDEVQMIAEEGMEEIIGALAVEKIKEAGRTFGLRCELDGEFKIGDSWRSTH